MKKVHTQGALAARKILLAVTGLTPQVVTETLYALACRDEAPWIPDEIHLITTVTGAENARLNLLAGQGWFHRLVRDYGLPTIAFPAENIHVLVSEPYETNRDCFYPTPYDHPIHGRQGNKEVTVDARNARVELADIPFVRLRDGLPKELLQGNASFSRIVSIANRSLEAPHLRLNVPQCHAWADDGCLNLTATEFLLLLWLAQRILRDEAATDWSAPDMADEFLAVAASARRCLYAVFTRFGRRGDIGVHQGNLFKKPVLLAITGAALTPSSYLGAHFTG